MTYDHKKLIWFPQNECFEGKKEQSLKNEI